MTAQMGVSKARPSWPVVTVSCADSRASSAGISSSDLGEQYVSLTPFPVSCSSFPQLAFQDSLLNKQPALEFLPQGPLWGNLSQPKHFPAKVHVRLMQSALRTMLRTQ